MHFNLNILITHIYYSHLFECSIFVLSYLDFFFTYLAFFFILFLLIFILIFFIITSPFKHHCAPGLATIYLKVYMTFCVTLSLP